jgi:AbrB family looped-hinge helix DNA binding protein
MTATLVISSQGQVTVPKNVRDLIGVKPGSQLLAQVVGGNTGYKLVLQPKPSSWAKTLAGTGKNLWGNSDKYITSGKDKWA